MDVFDTDTPCPKCGSDRASTGWCHGHARRAGCPNRDSEHMHRTCARCGYEWLERPLDCDDKE